MITAEIRVNGQMIGHIYCINEKRTRGPGRHCDALDEGWDEGWYEYSYEYYRPGLHIIKGKVRHFRDNDAAALMKEVFDTIMKGGK